MLEQPSQFDGADSTLLAQQPHWVALEQRLERGWQLMERREREGRPTEDLLHHFLTLLGEYEAIYGVQGATRP
jgi:hypothetical protein